MLGDAHPPTGKTAKLSGEGLRDIACACASGAKAISTGQFSARALAAADIVLAQISWLMLGPLAWPAPENADGVFDAAARRRLASILCGRFIVRVAR
jgi:hypothetical protein